MSIEYTDDPMPTTGTPDTYICLFPSIGLKERGQYETYLTEIYNIYPHADYYDQHKLTGTRGVPGEHVIFPNKGGPTLVNMYIKVYPGSKTYANDNPFKRKHNFDTIFQQLSQKSRDVFACSSIKKLHIEIPSSVASEKQEYLSFLEDFMGTCELHGCKPLIYIHGAHIEKKQQITEKKKPKISIAVKKPPMKAFTSASSPVPVPVPVPVQYKLEFDEDHLNSVVLYEVDFVKGIEAKAKPETETETVLKYFPTDPKWERIVSDTKLQHEAAKVQAKLGDQFGQNNIFPPAEELFNAFAYLRQPPKVVILGQDPYHGPGQAHGLSFSVKKGINVPPSLRNIYNALENDPDVVFSRPKHGHLKSWAEQGVIMLNTSLSVEQKKPKSHLSTWVPFTDRLIELLATKFEGLIFVLWGNDAKSKKTLITGKSHVILEFNHPSPMVRNNTFGKECQHFSQINHHLAKKKKTEIDWRLED
jgi:uracil-DNA glycosylase